MVIIIQTPTTINCLLKSVIPAMPTLWEFIITTLITTTPIITLIQIPTIQIIRTVAIRRQTITVAVIHHHPATEARARLLADQAEAATNISYYLLRIAVGNFFTDSFKILP